MAFIAIQTRKFILKEVFTKKDRTILSEKILTEYLYTFKGTVWYSSIYHVVNFTYIHYFDLYKNLGGSNMSNVSYMLWIYAWNILSAQFCHDYIKVWIIFYFLFIFIKKCIFYILFIWIYALKVQKTLIIIERKDSGGLLCGLNILN